ncbi:conjugal transfer protein TraH [Nostoc sp. CHAB 5834]|nr:conjugal transfer protein TraH [Nostoc sp. CHAB 5834]
MIRKKLMASVMALSMLLQPFSAGAVDLNDAFKSLLGPETGVAVNAPGRYQSSARSGFSGGGLDVRVPRRNAPPILFTASTPKVSAGCNGISAHFGGFSFISGEEFVKLLKDIASGAALGFVSALVMKTLCPPCEAIVQELKAAAQLAARLARDSCSIGYKAGLDFKAGLLGPSNDASTALAAEGGASSNLFKDAQDGYNALGSNMQKVADTIRSARTSFESAVGSTGGSGGNSGAGSNQALQCAAAGLFGNQTWRRMAALDNSTDEASAQENYKRKLMLMNVTGALMTLSSNQEVKCDLGEGKTWVATKEETNKFCPPQLESTKLVGFFMCGSPSNFKNSSAEYQISDRVSKYCGGFFPPTESDATSQVWTCDGADRQLAEKDCPYLKLGDASEIFKGSGFLLETNRLLREAVKRVRNNEALNGGSGDAVGTEIVKLINTAPFPLYQAINAAAVYPAATEDLLDSMSILIAEQFAYAYFDEVTRVNGRATGTMCISEYEVTSLMSFTEKLRSINYERKTQMAQSLVIQQTLHEQIRTINQAIQKQVLSSQMLSNSQAASALNSAVSRSLSSSGTTSGANNP